MKRLHRPFLAIVAGLALTACAGGAPAAGSPPTAARVAPPGHFELRAVAPEAAGVERLQAWDGGSVAVGSDRLVLDSGVREVRVVRDPERDGMALSVQLAEDTRERVAAFTRRHVGEKVALVVGGRSASTLTVRDPVDVPVLLLTGRDDATVQEMERRLEAGR